MATTRPFSRNLGSSIAGTSQVGNLAIGTPTSGFEATALKWWMGADEDLGYVIAIEDPSGLHIGADGVQAFIGFKRSAVKTEASFLQLVQSLTGQTFTTGANAKTWLNANGMWTSWGLESEGEGTPTPSGFTVAIDEVGNDVIMEFSGSLNIDALTLLRAGEALGGGGLGISTATFLSGPINSTFDVYGGAITAPTSFGTGMGLPNSSSEGSVFGVIFQNAPPYELVVPANYSSGLLIFGSQTFANTTLAELGLVNGTYSYSWGSGANAESFDVVVGEGGVTGGGSGNGGGSAGNNGTWSFYSDESVVDVGPPSANGQIIFTTSAATGQVEETFDPNKSNGIAYVTIFPVDLNNNDFTAQFVDLQQTGGTISLTQNGNTATYNLLPGMTFIETNTNPNFVSINVSAATQTAASANPFVMMDPITVTIS